MLVYRMIIWYTQESTVTKLKCSLHMYKHTVRQAQDNYDQLGKSSTTKTNCIKEIRDKVHILYTYIFTNHSNPFNPCYTCLLYTSDAADE